MRGDPFLPALAHAGNRLSKLGGPDAEIFVDELEESEKSTEPLQEDQGPDLAQADVTELKELMREAVGELRKVESIFAAVGRRLDAMMDGQSQRKRRRTGSS